MKINISVVIPIYNEIGSLPDLCQQLNTVLTTLKPFEIIFIDDGSTDGSGDYLHGLATEDENVILIQFQRNYGKAAALAEGFRQAQGEYIVTIDGDLQDDPAEIPNLLKKIEAGYDLVSGWKKDRKDPIGKKIPSRFFNFITRVFTGVKIHDFNCGLKIYRKSVIKTLDLYGGRHRYIPALAGQKNFKITEIAVNHRPRLHGESKYGGARLFHGFFDLLSVLFLGRYNQSPLYLFGQIGFFTTITGLIIELYVMYLKYSLGEPFQKHVALLLFGILIIVVGIQFFSIGLIGEMIAQANQGKETRIKSLVKKTL
ncbi:MAG: glycosyltransferase family 2 protein [Candidatus Neomarinimicrobiota bacterium]